MLVKPFLRQNLSSRTTLTPRSHHLRLLHAISSLPHTHCFSVRLLPLFPLIPRLHLSPPPPSPPSITSPSLSTTTTTPSTTTSTTPSPPQPPPPAAAAANLASLLSRAQFYKPCATVIAGRLTLYQKANYYYTTLFNDMSHAKSLTTEGTMANISTAPPSPPNAPSKGGETIEDLFKRLPPHGPPDCVTRAWKDETIDELLSRIPTSEGFYKLFCKLIHKSKSEGLGTDQQEMIRGKACTSRDKACCLLAIEINLGEVTLDHTVANSVVKR